ncbi:hypothetical protein GCM10020358_12450 [Amorphoplanes nipponensis]|uniref:Uncharacterized protein n=1 Tax=Actinoplanes nipponensis TaxID=135950 RepID=A0A919MQN1_9ACTN|nr:hypothetical protein Ani05nite_42520 [Actinoplanes nipponensis]
MYGIPATVGRPATGACWVSQPGAHRPSTSRNKGVNVMGIAILLFFVAIAVASGAGLTFDSRDSGDWKPTADGVRAPDRW